MKKTSILALLLVFTVLFSACGGGTVASQESSETAQPVSETVASTEPAAPVEEETAPVESSTESEIEAEASLEESVAVAEPLALPLCDTVTEISAWQPANPIVAPFLEEGYNSVAAFQKAEELTNVHINWVSPAIGVSNEDFNLMLASEDYTDLIYNFTRNYTRGVDTAVEEEIIVDMKNLIDQGCMPSFNSIIQSDEGYIKGVSTDEGRIGQACQLADKSERGDRGMLIRKDWLDELNLEIPETYDDVYEILRAFQSEFGIGGLWLPADGINVNDCLIQGFGVPGKYNVTGNQVPLYLAEGNVAFGPANEGYKDYVSLMAKWYAEGLIYSDFVTELDPFGISSTLILNDQVGFFQGPAANITSNKASSSDPNFELAAVPEIVQNSGDKTHLLYIPGLVDTTGVAIAASCAEPELAANWVDFWYSETGTNLGNYGVEGVSYSVADDGAIVWCEDIANNAYGLGAGLAINIYAFGMAPFYWHTERLDSCTAQEELDAYKIWNERSDSRDYYPIAYVSLTEEEGATVNSCVAELTTYIAEKTLKWIVGESSVEAEWDEYIVQLEQFGLESYLEVYQAAYERYLER